MTVPLLFASVSAIFEVIIIHKFNGSCFRLPVHFRVNFPVQKGNSNITAKGIFKKSASRLLTCMGMKNALVKL